MHVFADTAFIVGTGVTWAISLNRKSDPSQHLVTSVSTNTIIYNTEPAVVFLLGVPLVREKGTAMRC